jgi:hypothetical protein
MIHERRHIEAQHSATGLDTIAAVKVTDDGVERQEWVGTWEDVQYTADLMPPLSPFLRSVLGEYAGADLK